VGKGSANFTTLHNLAIGESCAEGSAQTSTVRTPRREHHTMHHQGRWRKVLCKLIAAAGLFSSAGCLSFIHPVEPAPAELAGACRELPHCCRNHVHIFLVHGLDPLDSANLSGLCKHMHELGFNNTHYGQLYHAWFLEKEIRRVHHEDAEARFVLIGFSFGANVVRSITQHVKDEGIRVDLLVYLGGNTLDNVPYDRPDNTGHIVNILASGCIWNGAWLDGATNIHETDVWHFGSPCHPETVEILNEHLLALAASVPAPTPTLMRPTDDEPTPRPVMPPAVSQHRDDWDFLKPVSRLRETPPAKDGDGQAPAPDNKKPTKEKVAMR
jgi:hypothetical protein